MIKSIITLFFLIWTFTIFSQDRFADVIISETQLTDNVYMLEGSGGNMGLLIGDGETLLIDDQFGPLSEKIADKIASLGGGTVTRLVNTHWHGDHSGGNENFGTKGAMIVAHDNVRLRMSTEQDRGGRITPASPQVALPVVTYNDKATLHFFNEPVLLIHMHNAHTDGDSFVFLPESNVLHMGDCFFHQRFPYIDLDSGGSVKGVLAATEAALLLSDDETKIIPGHGPLATRADLVKYNEFLKLIIERVEEFVHNGRGTESADADKIVEGYEDWTWGFIDAQRFTSIVFNSLSKG